MRTRDEDDQRFATTLAQVARPLAGRPDDDDELIELIGESRFVLLGEASHGTHDFYAARARITRRRYSCFESFGESTEAYAFLASADRLASCEQQAIEQLVALRRQPPPHDPGDDDELFYAVQNAQLVVDAEQYYRAMYRG